MRKPPTALVLIVFALVALVAYAKYTPQAQQPRFFQDAVERISALVPGLSNDRLRFDPPAALPDAMEGKPYLPNGEAFSFCDPPTATSLVSCPPSGGVGRNPRGGVPPYRFALGTGGGAPPAQMVLDANGRFTGTPAIGTGGQRYEWFVCAVDAQGTSVCRCVALFVGTATSTASGAAPCTATGGGTITGNGTGTDGGTTTATGTATGGGTTTATGTATGGGTATATGTAAGTATRTAPRTATPGPIGQLTGTWVGPDTQTDTACDYAGSVRLTITQSGTMFAGTAAYTLDLTRDKVGGFCLPTRNYALAVSGAMDGQAVTFTIGGAWKYTGTIEGGTLKAVGSVTSAGITTTDTMTVVRQ